MAADAVSRKTVRDALAALFSAALTGTGKPVQTVYGYPLDYDISKDTPYLTIAGHGSNRRDMGSNNPKYYDVFAFEVATWFRSADNASGWTESLLEDQMDLVDKEIADVVADNRSNSNWSWLGFSPEISGAPEPSTIIPDPQRGCVIEVRKIYVHYIEA